MRWLLLPLLLPVLLPVAALAVGGEASPGGPEAVGGLWLDSEFACSAVLYDSDRAVTAGHCVDHLPPGDVRGELRVGAASAPVARATLHPDYFAAPDADLAVLWLEQSVDVTPLALAEDAPDADWDLWTVQVAGWGADDPDALPVGALRSFAARLDDVTLSSLVFDGGPAWVCDGDSGGAVVLPGEAADRLVGVVVGGPGDCAGPGEAVRVDVFARFLADPEGTGPGDVPFGADPDEELPEDEGGAAIGGFRGGEADFGEAGCALGGRPGGAPWVLWGFAFLVGGCRARSRRAR